MAELADVWAQGDAYEPYVGRWSRLVAAEVLRRLATPAGRRWIDVGCGTGAVTSTIVASAEPAEVVGVDPSEGFLAYARRNSPTATFQVGSATELPFVDGRFDVALSGLVLNFVPDPARAAVEMARVTRSGGVVAAYLWDYADGMQLIRMFWDAAVELDPGVQELVEGLRFPLCQPEPMRELFLEAGLSDVAVEAVEVPTRFADFGDYWTPFLGGQGPAPGYAMSLSDDRRDALRDRLRATMSYRPDGSILLTARAWLARGRR
jgi:SAM-dependent methyltransferase